MKPSNVTLLHIVLLLALGAAVFLPSLGRETGLDDREARHAEIAREMAQSGEYLVPYVLGKPYIDKPPLFNVSVALMFQLTGRVDFWTARLPGALCSMAMILAIYLLGRRWYNARTGLWAAAIWATSWIVVEWGRTARMDMMMAGLILFGILLADVAVAGLRQWTRAALWCAASLLIAGAVLSKGPQALFFFAVAFVCFWRARRGRWLPPWRYWISLVVIVGGVAAGWAVITELRHQGHLQAMMNYEYQVGVVGHLKRPWLYFDQLLIRTAPWGLFSVGAIYWLVRRWRRSGCDRTLVPFLAFAVSIIVMTFVPNKREHYLLPILPLWALFLAGFLDSAVSERQRPLEQGGPARAGRAIPRWAFELPLYVCLIGFAALACGGGGWWLTSKHAGKAVSAAVFGIALVGAAAGIHRAVRGAKPLAVALLMLTAVLLAMAATPVMKRYLISPPPEVAASARVASAIPAGAAVGEYAINDEYLFFKLNRDVTFIQEKDTSELARYLEAPGPRYLLVESARVSEIKRSAKRPLQEVGTWQLGRDAESAVSLLVTPP